jgi:hypothetical protein
MLPVPGGATAMRQVSGGCAGPNFAGPPDSFSVPERLWESAAQHHRLPLVWGQAAVWKNGGPVMKFLAEKQEWSSFCTVACVCLQKRLASDRGNNLRECNT